MTTLLEALQHILDSKAVNEGPDARCVLLGADGDPVKPVAVRDLIACIRASTDQRDANEPVRINRTMRNWEILRLDGDPIVQAHPWDDSPNVARLGVRPDATHIASLVEFSGRVQQLANEAERLRQFVIAKNLWEMVGVINHYCGAPTVNAIQEALRLGGLVAAMTGQPVKTAQQERRAT